MTDQEIKELAVANLVAIKELQASQAKTDEQIKASQIAADKRMDKLEASQAKTDEQIKASQIAADKRMDKLEASQAKTDIQLAKTEKLTASNARSIKYFNKYILNQAFTNEDKFYQGLKDQEENNNLIIDGILYDFVDKNVKGRTKTILGQYDIVLYNSKNIFIIEVKTKPHTSDLDQLLEQKQSFPKIFKDYQDFDIHLGLAGDFMYNEIFTQAKKLGIYILQTKANKIKVTKP